jgi:hypothetical protein
MFVDGDNVGGSFLKFTSIGETDCFIKLLGVGGRGESGGLVSYKIRGSIYCPGTRSM